MQNSDLINPSGQVLSSHDVYDLIQTDIDTISPTFTDRFRGSGHEPAIPTSIIIRPVSVTDITCFKTRRRSVLKQFSTYYLQDIICTNPVTMAAKG